MANFSCLSPLTGVVLGIVETAESTAMYHYGLTASDNYTAGRPRRCLSADDLDGVNALYPSCGGNMMLSPPPCGYRADGFLVFIRIFEDFFKAISIPLAVICGMKLLSFVFLYTEDCVATRQVRKAARDLLNEHGSLRRGSTLARGVSAQLQVLKGVGSSRFSFGSGSSNKKSGSGKFSSADAAESTPAQDDAVVTAGADSGAGVR